MIREKAATCRWFLTNLLVLRKKSQREMMVVNFATLPDCRERPGMTRLCQNSLYNSSAGHSRPPADKQEGLLSVLSTPQMLPPVASRFYQSLHLPAKAPYSITSSFALIAETPKYPRAFLPSGSRLTILPTKAAGGLSNRPPIKAVWVCN